MLVVPAEEARDDWKGRASRLLLRMGPGDGGAGPGLRLALQPLVPAQRPLRRRGPATKEFTALRDIEPGEEIVVNYNGEPADDSPVGFPILMADPSDLPAPERRR